MSEKNAPIKKEAVVFIHGIWMNGIEMTLLRQRVACCGYECHQFRYRSVSNTPRENAAVLNAYLATLNNEVIHLVAHSLGGIVVMHLFNDFPQQKPGRVLLIGSPINGSLVAKHIFKTGVLRGFLGHSVHEGLLGNVPQWKSGHEIGMIAGTKGIGLGMLLVPGALEKPNDGTVSQSATQSDAINEHRAVPYSHMGMLIALPVVKLVCQFLRKGRFK